MGADLTSIENALKENYFGAIVDRLNNVNAYYMQLEKNSEKVQASGKGLKAIFAMRTRDNQGLGTRAENAALPTARQTSTIQLEVPLKYVYGEIRFTGPAVAASAKNETRFAEVVDDEVNSMTKSMKNEIGMQVLSPSIGFMCQANGAGGGADATVTVDNPGTIWLKKGMPIESRAYSVATGVGTLSASDANDISNGLTEATAHQVGTINSSTSFELETYAGVAKTDETWNTNRYIFRYGSGTAGTSPTQVHGLLTLIDSYALSNASTSSYFGLDLALITIQNQSRATYTELDANIIHNNEADQPFSEDLIQQALDTVATATGEESHSGQMMLMDYACRRTFINYLQADRSFSPQTLNLKGGYSVIGYQAGNDWIPIVAERLMPNGIILIPNLRFIKIFRFQDFDWMDKQGSMFQPAFDSSGKYDAYTAMGFVYFEQGCTSFQDQVAIRDVGTL